MIIRLSKMYFTRLAIRLVSSSRRARLAITVIFVAVILLGLGVFNLLSKDKEPVVQNVVKNIVENSVYRHALNGSVLEDPEQDFFAISIMFDNAYNARPQYGLDKADIVYEALAEGNITRLLGVFDSRQNVNKIGPVRSALQYFMDWAGEYNGIYMHVGGSPNALASVSDYDFYNIDQIGAGEIYFWRDNDLEAPHNVFTSSSNWLRAGEMRAIPDIEMKRAWFFTDVSNSGENVFNISIDYNEPYQIDWIFNNKLNTYLRFQGDKKFIYHTGEQARADNVIIQVASSRIVDAKERRIIRTQEGGQVFIFNKLGQQEGTWEIIDGRTVFFDENKNELKLAAGKTWVQVIPSEDYLIIK